MIQILVRLLYSIDSTIAFLFFSMFLYIIKGTLCISTVNSLTFIFAAIYEMDRFIFFYIIIIICLFI